VLVLANGGADLEHSTLASLQQAKSILFQVCLSIAAIEKVRRTRSTAEARRRLTGAAEAAL
jgi:hypothetical protein